MASQESFASSKMGPFTTRFVDVRRRNNFYNLVEYLKNAKEVVLRDLYTRQSDTGLSQDELLSDLSFIASNGALEGYGVPMREIFKNGNAEFCFLFEKIQYNPRK
jgi:hypothetical protein